MHRRLEAATVFADMAFPLALIRNDDHAPCPVHSHGFHELVLILAGRGRHVTDREEYPIEAGDVFLLRDDMAHGYANTERMTLYNILFDPHRLRLPLVHLQDSPGYQALFRVEPELRKHDRFRNRLRLSEEELAEAAGMIARLQEELGRQKPGYRFQACADLMDLIGFLSRCYSRTVHPSARPPLRMGEVLSYIEQHYREPITVRQLTRIAGMSESTLLRTFRRVLGRSPIEHVIRVRILHASEWLQRGDSRVTEVAFECGFSDSNYFSRQFRKVMGSTPRAFRLRPAASRRR
jgi:AraC-like DNA-binding protein